MRLKDNSCACGAASSQPLFETTDFNFRTTDQRTTVRQCTACGSHFPEQFPLTEDLSGAYANYYTAAAPRNPVKRAARALLDVPRAGYLSRETPATAKSVLDYGCGAGEYLLHLNRTGHGARLFGTDISRPSAADSGAFEWTPVERFQALGQGFDWITLSHVIEHLPDAREVMLRVRAACNPSGAVWISTPNADSFLTRVFGAHSRDVDFPRHRQIFSRLGLTQLLRETGFEVSFCEAPRINAALNMVSCLKNLWRDEDVAMTRKLRVSLRAALHLCLHTVAAGVRRSHSSPELVLIARPVAGA